MRTANNENERESSNQMGRRRTVKRGAAIAGFSGAMLALASNAGSVHADSDLEEAARTAERTLNTVVATVDTVGEIAGTAGKLLDMLQGESLDKIKRSCKGEYLVEYNGSQVVIGQMEARRGCGRLAANKCRRRARQQIQECMKAHMASPTSAPSQLPHCLVSEDRGAGMVKYDVDVLQTAVLNAGRNWYSNVEVGDTFKAAIYGRTSGDTGCGSKSNRSEIIPLGHVTYTRKN